jgi:hypothetical protein
MIKMELKDFEQHVGTEIDISGSPFTLVIGHSPYGSSPILYDDFHEIFTLLNHEGFKLTLVIVVKDDELTKGTIICIHEYEHEVPDFKTYSLIVQALVELVLSNYYMESAGLNVQLNNSDEACDSGCGGCGGSCGCNHKEE